MLNFIGGEKIPIRLKLRDTRNGKGNLIPQNLTEKPIR
jgi:hypothetical protein